MKRMIITRFVRDSSPHTDGLPTSRYVGLRQKRECVPWSMLWNIKMMYHERPVVEDISPEGGMEILAVLLFFIRGILRPNKAIIRIIAAVGDNILRFINILHSPVWKAKDGHPEAA